MISASSSSASASDHFNFCAKYSQLSSVPSSPERRFKSISPCRRLFEDVSTNSNHIRASPSPFVVSNTTSSPSMTTTNFAPFFSNNNNHSKDNVTKDDNNEFNYYFDGIETNSKEPLSSTLSDTILNNNSQIIVEGLTDILYSSYQRRRSINNNNNRNSTSNSISNTRRFSDNFSSPILMDDLGFLSTTNTKKHMINYEHEDSIDSVNPVDFIENNTIEDIDGHIKCSIPTKLSHWNRRSSTNFTFRRTMSTTTDNRNCIPAVPVMSENGLIHHLPCFDSPHDAIKRISPDTLADLLDGTYSQVYERLLVIDCRYPYEYEGGHIPSAININDPEIIEKMLFEAEETRGRSTVIVFHCEFSSERAPRMALHVRSIDRQLNTSNYPNLIYPEIYILQGGYKNYWQTHGDKCDGSYRQMRNPQFKDQLRHHQRTRYSFKSAGHLSQHSAIKRLPPKSRKQRSKSLNIANARKFFNDLIDKKDINNNKDSREGKGKDEEENDLSFNNENTTAHYGHMFPSYTIPMVNSFSSIFASELDIPSEMEMDYDQPNF